MIKRTFDPGFRIELHQKDLNLALASARALGVSLPNTATAQELFNACAAHGGKAWDHSAMVKALETLANFEIGQQADRVGGPGVEAAGAPAAPHVRCGDRQRRSRRCASRRTCRAPPKRPAAGHRRRQGLGGDGAGGRGALAGRRSSGLVVTRYGYAVPCEHIEIVEAAHPVPDDAGLAAAERMLELVAGPARRRPGAVPDLRRRLVAAAAAVARHHARGQADRSTARC